MNNRQVRIEGLTLCGKICLKNTRLVEMHGNLGLGKFKATPPHFYGCVERVKMKKLAIWRLLFNLMTDKSSGCWDTYNLQQ
jgi:hypothetical protein